MNKLIVTITLLFGLYTQLFAAGLEPEDGISPKTITSTPSRQHNALQLQNQDPNVLIEYHQHYRFWNKHENWRRKRVVAAASTFVALFPSTMAALVLSEDKYNVHPLTVAAGIVAWGCLCPELLARLYYGISFYQDNRNFPGFDSDQGRIDYKARLDHLKNFLDQDIKRSRYLAPLTYTIFPAIMLITAVGCYLTLENIDPMTYVESGQDIFRKAMLISAVGATYLAYYLNNNIIWDTEATNQLRRSMTSRQS